MKSIFIVLGQLSLHLLDNKEYCKIKRIRNLGLKTWNTELKNLIFPFQFLEEASINGQRTADHLPICNHISVIIIAFDLQRATHVPHPRQFWGRTG
jgi:hypothetical protein